MLYRLFHSPDGGDMPSLAAILTGSLNKA